MVPCFPPHTKALRQHDHIHSLCSGLIFNLSGIMSPPTTPYMGITDPDDLEESKFSLEFARSLNTAEDSAPLMARSDENEKEHLAASGSQGRLETLGWMAANAIATIGIVRLNAMFSSGGNRTSGSPTRRSSPTNRFSRPQNSKVPNLALRHITSSLLGSCSTYSRDHDSVAWRQRKSRFSKCCRQLYRYA